MVAGSTQAAIAKAVGVTQPTYQRWEVESVVVPDVKLAKLATLLKTTKKALIGRRSPVAATLYDNSAPENLRYYGEVAVHFRGGGASLLLSISEEERIRLFENLDRDHAFLVTKDLGNRTVAIRRTAISDLYLSSEAYDDFGPGQHEPGYKDGTPLQLPDPRDWEIIESLACHGAGLRDFSEEDVERVRDAVLITDKKYEKFVADGRIKPEVIATKKAKNAVLADRLFEMATNCRRGVSEQ